MGLLDKLSFLKRNKISIENADIPKRMMLTSKDGGAAICVLRHESDTRWTLRTWDETNVLLNIYDLGGYPTRGYSIRTPENSNLFILSHIINPSRYDLKVNPSEIWIVYFKHNPDSRVKRRWTIFGPRNMPLFHIVPLASPEGKLTFEITNPEGSRIFRLEQVD